MTVHRASILKNCNIKTQRWRDILDMGNSPFHIVHTGPFLHLGFFRLYSVLGRRKEELSKELCFGPGFWYSRFHSSSIGGSIWVTAQWSNEKLQGDRSSATPPLAFIAGTYSKQGVWVCVQGIIVSRVCVSTSARVCINIYKALYVCVWALQLTLSRVRCYFRNVTKR